MEDSRCQKGQQKFIRAWNIETVRHQVTISHRVSCLVFHVCSECESMHRGSKSVRTPSLYARKESQRFSFELLNLCSHIRQTPFPARKDMKVRFKTTHIWGANISLQWAGKCSLYRTPVEGRNIYWPHNHEPIHESKDVIKFLPQVPIFPHLSAYLPLKSTAFALSSDGGLSVEMWSCCQIEIF